MSSAQPTEKAAHKTQRTFIKQAGIATTSYQPQGAHQAILNDSPLPSIKPLRIPPYPNPPLPGQSLVSQHDAE